MTIAFKWVLCLVLFALLGSIFFPEFFTVPLQFAFALAFGWIAYLGRVVLHVNVAWPALLSALACLVGAVALGHTFTRWLWRETAPDPATAARPPWRFRWTLAATAVVVLMFTAGIAATGITHQSAWLARDGRWVEYRGRERANRVKCASNLRQIGQAVLLYAHANSGHYPDSLARVLLSEDVSSEMFICPSSNSERAPGTTPQEQARHLHPGRGHCDYVYFGRGLRDPVPATYPVACEPLINHNAHGMNILFGDGHVEWFDPATAARILHPSHATDSRTTPPPANASPPSGARP